MPGPIGQYCFNYNLKGTQKSDREEYEQVKTACQTILSKMKKYDNDASEAVRRLLATSFAHQSNNIIGAALASFLTRNDSRFIFSHSFIWCPLRDIKSLLKGEKVSAMVTFQNKMSYFQCSALHYLCRPTELGNLSAYEFYRKYEVIKVTSTNMNTLLMFSNTEHFVHPSFLSRQKCFRQGVRLRKKESLVKIHQYDFPDSANFNGSILDSNCNINEDMEMYCEQVLLLFYPFRRKEDLCLENSYTKKLRDAISSGQITELAFTILQNIQDTKSNSFRMTITKDELQRETEALESEEMINHSDEIQSDMDTNDINGIDLEQFLLDLNEDTENGDLTEDNENIPFKYNCKTLRNKGRLKCGYDCLPDIATCNIQNNAFIDVLEMNNDLENEQLTNDGYSSTEQTHHTPTKQDIIYVLITKSQYHMRTFEDITDNTVPVSVMLANGSVKSIIDWSMKANFDKQQRRAFEVITGTFVLSYYYTADGNMDDRHSFLLEKRRLQILVDESKRKTKQLICFLHGPAGCGKTSVIDLVVCYCKEYCMLLQNQLTHDRPIVVTALTGVAATIIQGETTHSAVYLNQKNTITIEQVELWLSTRLLIIDEISFASKDEIRMLHKKLRRLKQQLDMKFGGLNVVFVGDMRQLEPVGRYKKPIYAEDVPEFKDWVNCYIELGGIHRFKDDPEWGALLLRFRNGEVTKHDIELINERVCNTKCTLPENIRYATYFNRDRDAINTALFEERAKKSFINHQNTNGFIMIFSDDVQVKNSSQKYIQFRKKKLYWEECGEDDIIMSKGSGRMDPVLKLYKGCRVMLPTNVNVSCGQANGTQAIVEKIVLKSGEDIHHVFIGDNVPIMAAFASQVAYVELKHVNSRVRPQKFIINPKTHVFKARIPKPKIFQGTENKETELIQMKANQVPILVNNATTGHKLQGCGVDTLFVHNWSYVRNWVYVMLSRVKKLCGLFARKPLSEDLSKYTVPDALKKMIQKFHMFTPVYFTEEQYTVIAESPYSELLSIFN
jgi:hypothetical protein